MQIDNSENNQEQMYNSHIHRIGYSDIWNVTTANLKEIYTL